MGEQRAPKRRLARRRQENVAGGRQRSHRVLVSEAQERRLAALAEQQRVTVPRLLIESALASGGETPTQRRHALVALFALRRLVAGLATNVNQLAAQANATGRFPDEAEALGPELWRAVRRIDDAIDGLAAT